MGAFEHSERPPPRIEHRAKPSMPKGWLRHSLPAHGSCGRQRVAPKTDVNDKGPLGTKRSSPSMTNPRQRKEADRRCRVVEGQRPRKNLQWRHLTRWVERWCTAPTVTLRCNALR
jgi:hypothetical protein